VTAHQEAHVTQTLADTSWQANATGPAHTTHAGRLALPIAVSLGGCTVATVEVVLDGDRAAQLYKELGAHLRGRGTPVVCEAAQ
jgi:formate-dependent phosphoribosylglycinamide formyltransferase (GAR transformylase)